MRDAFWVGEVREHARLALRYAERSDHAHLLATLKAVENLYEASTALSDDTRQELFPDGEDEALRGTRNFYIHQYHRVDADMARKTVQRHFPGLVERAEAWMAEHGKGT